MQLQNDLSNILNIPYWMSSTNIVHNLVGIIIYIIVVSVTFSISATWSDGSRGR